MLHESYVSEALRPAVLRIVVWTVLVCGPGGTAIAQEAPLEFVEFTVGCREEPAPGPAISLQVLAAWVEVNTLFVDLTVTNHSNSEIQLPARNAGGHYWDAVLYDGKGEPIVYCGGVSEFNLDPFLELITEADVVSARAKETIVLKRIALAPFWPYLREPHHNAQSFAVFYTGWAHIVLHMDRTTSEKLRPELERASARQCKLYGSKLQSRRQSLANVGG